MHKDMFKSNVVWTLKIFTLYLINQNMVLYAKKAFLINENSLFKLDLYRGLFLESSVCWSFFDMVLRL